MRHARATQKRNQSYLKRCCLFIASQSDSIRVGEDQPLHLALDQALQTVKTNEVPYPYAKQGYGAPSWRELDELPDGTIKGKKVSRYPALRGNTFAGWPSLAVS
jgi:hypothetical protein